MKTAWFALAVAALLLLSGSAYIVHEGQVGVLFQFGRIIQSDIKPGLHFKLPLIQNALRFDRRIYTLNAEPDRYMTQEKRTSRSITTPSGGSATCDVSTPPRWVAKSVQSND